VLYLEERIAGLELLLEQHGIPRPSANDVALHSKPEDTSSRPSHEHEPATDDLVASIHDAASHTSDANEDVDRLVSNIRMVSSQGTSDPRYLGSTSGISFARVVFAAIRSSVPGSANGNPSSKKAGDVGIGQTSMHDSFFGLSTKPTIKEAPFPEKDVALKLVDRYFNYANCQIPILHREQFMSQLRDIYKKPTEQRTARELYTANIVFAIGAGVILGSAPSSASLGSDHQSSPERQASPSSTKRQKLTHQAQPEEYHASAIVHLGSFLGSPAVTEPGESFGSGLEELQAVLLLASFALLRPVAPGLWYIVGVALRLAIDLGLHHEEGIGVDETVALDVGDGNRLR
jgi:hypothetical protein